jgi:uncharacterized membrane protein SpoIIM required for sporulation
MDYARFVALRRPLWDGFADQLSRPRKRLSYAEVEEMALRYRQVLHDHAFARARFPDTGAARRLAGLAVQGASLLQQEEQKAFSFVRFFFVRFPAAVRDHLPEMGVVTALFLVTALLGWVTALVEPSMTVALLGPERIADLEQGRLWTESLTTTVPAAYSSSAIATNNMSVAITAWAGGALAGIGALWVVLFNGFYLGAVFGVTARFAMAGELLEFVTAHGPLEITLILVSAGAGLAVGRTLLMAGDLPRSITLPRAAREAMVVLVGCLPWFGILALVEALLSPSPTLAWSWKLVLGLALEVCFLAPVAIAALAAPPPPKPAAEEVS